MSFDIKVGITKSYKMSLSITEDKHFINRSNSTIDDVNTYEVINNRYINKVNGEQVFSGIVSAQLTLKNTTIDKSVPNQDRLFYLKKNGATYSYTKDKPFSYSTNNSYKTIKDVPEGLIIKSNRGLIHSKGIEGDSAWMQFSFPFGGITKSSLILGYSYNNIFYNLEVNDNIKIDLLEGMVYIKQDYTTPLDNLVGYFDIEPLEIDSTDYLKITGKSEDLYCTHKQKNLFGDITVETISDTSYVVTFSFNTFIIPSDPYFISVDGINLLTPRHIIKNTPILIEQTFDVVADSFTEYSSQLFNGVESKEVELLTSSIKFDSKENYELFNADKTSAGLFLYREAEEGVYDTTRPAYLPLFSPQTIIKEY